MKQLGQNPEEANNLQIKKSFNFSQVKANNQHRASLTKLSEINVVFETAIPK